MIIVNRAANVILTQLDQNDLPRILHNFEISIPIHFNVLIVLNTGVPSYTCKQDLLDL